MLALSSAWPAVAAERREDRPENGDPNRIICRTQEVIGSRLRSQKHCLTAQEWTDIRQENRRTLEKVQGGGWKGS